jgi:hypothetical protein
MNRTSIQRFGECGNRIAKHKGQRPFWPSSLFEKLPTDAITATTPDGGHPNLWVPPESPANRRLSLHGQIQV